GSPPGPLSWYVFGAVAVRADGARRSRRFSVAQTRGLCGKAASQEIAIVKRPEGRAPSPMLVGALNTYLPWGDGSKQLDHIRDGVCPTTIGQPPMWKIANRKS